MISLRIWIIMKNS